MLRRYATRCTVLDEAAQYAPAGYHIPNVGQFFPAFPISSSVEHGYLRVAVDEKGRFRLDHIVRPRVFDHQLHEGKYSTIGSSGFVVGTVHIVNGEHAKKIAVWHSRLIGGRSA